MTRYASSYGYEKPDPAPFDPEEHRRLRLQRDEHLRRNPGQDVVTTEQLEDASLSDLLGGGFVRHPITGEIRRDGEGQPIRTGEGEIPATISGEQLNAMMGVATSNPCTEPSAEDRFREEAKRQKHEAWKASISERFDAIARRKGAA